MTDKKHTGSYYTPEYLSNFIVRRISKLLTIQDKISILEPSVGDGSFLKSIDRLKLLTKYNNINITALDINQDELNKAEKVLSHLNYNKSFECCDFLAYSKNTQDRYNLIIGNPPYIKKNRLNESQISICQEIHQEAKLSTNSIKNIWTAFFVKSMQLLDENGILAFVLPAELLQVKFAEELRNYIQTQFERIEIYTFSNLLFECKGQDTIVLIGIKQSNKQGLFYANIEDKVLDNNTDYKLEIKNALVNTNVKWTHHTLNSDELTFLHKIKMELKNINQYCDSKPGIVTAANQFFIINEETESQYGLKKYTLPILQKSSFANGSVIFSKSDYEHLVLSGKPSKIISFKDNDFDDFDDRIKSYLSIGEKNKINQRYKCKIRENWFVIPNISTVPDGFFFKRCHNYPKLLKNEANVLVTDSAYKIIMFEDFTINQLIYSFYNSLTLTFAELEGRYYGGGVLELTPQEFKKLPIPMVSVTDKFFNSFIKEFDAKSKIDDILVKNDDHILNSTIGLNSNEIKFLQSIRYKLIQKRMR